MPYLPESRRERDTRLGKIAVTESDPETLLPCRERDRLRSVAVEAIDHHKRSRMRSRAKGRFDIELILQILPNLGAIDPEFHALGDSIEGIARTLEGVGLADDGSALRLADVHAERVGWRRIAVE